MAQLIGKIAKDAIVKTTKNQKELIEFSFVENHRYKTKEGEKKQVATFYNCTFWRSTALTPYLTKGTNVVINGQISARAYNDKEANVKANLNLHVTDIIFISRGNLPGENKTKSKAKVAAEAGNIPEPADNLPF
jgi:single-strand DNA-binding protein